MSDRGAPIPRSRRPLAMAVGVLVVAAVVYLLLALPGQGVAEVDRMQSALGSEPVALGSEFAAPATGEAVTEQASEAAPEGPSEGSGGSLYEVFSARDPFDQLVVGDSAPTGDVGHGPATTAPSGGPVTESAPSGPATGTALPGDGGSAGTARGEPAQAEVGVTTIRLDEVFREGGDDKVIVEVNRDGYEAAQGETVAGGLTVLDIADSCATMRFDGKRFILCEGERIEK